MAGPVAPAPAEVRSKAIGRIAVSLIAAWVALVAIPGAVPWQAQDNAAQALAFGVLFSSAVAIICLVLAIFLSDDRVVQPALIGTSAALIAVVLTGLEVINLMFVPADATYRPIATGVGLLVLLALASGIVGGLGGFFEGFKFSSLTLAGTVAAAGLIVVYLILVQSMISRTAPSTLDPEWLRLTTLLNGLQALAFAAAGALLGTAVQGQATSEAKADAHKADDAKEELEKTVVDLHAKAKTGQLIEMQTNQGALPPEALSARLENSLERARLLRRR